MSPHQMETDVYSVLHNAFTVTSINYVVKYKNEGKKPRLYWTNPVCRGMMRVLFLI